MLFVSGRGSLDPATGAVVPGDIVAQTRQTLDNIMSVSEAAGVTAKNIVNMRVILRNVADFPSFNETFREYFAGEKVTRTCFGGVLHRAGTDIEIDCVAMSD
jgi:2-iminobutanoate/2-iminopropanoate deaminase